MSHHLAAARAGTIGQLYIDDMYVFPGHGSTVFIMNVNSNVTQERAEPSFLPETRYEFKIHLADAPLESLAYRFVFGQAADDGTQEFGLNVLTGEDAASDDASGTVAITGRTGQVAEADGLRVWAGRSADSFYIDLSLLGLVNGAVRSGSALDLSTWHPDAATNSFVNTTVDTIVLEVRNTADPLQPGTGIAVWCSTKIDEGDGWHQINRFGHPMLWPIFWPDDIQFTHPANSRHPSVDFEQDGEEIAGLIASTVAASGTSGDPDAYGRAVAQILLPDVMSYVVGTPASYGFAGRNGRTMADNAPEAMLSLVTNTAVASGLKASVSEHLRAAEFPYVVPVSGL
jgi:hypothetical protein